MLTVALLLDDLFQVHERVAPALLHLGEDRLFAVYAAALAAYLVRFRRAILSSRFALLALALAGFAASLLLDLPRGAASAPTMDGTYVEDALKLLGILAWSGYFVEECLVACAPVVRTTVERRRPVTAPGDGRRT